MECQPMRMMIPEQKSDFEVRATNDFVLLFHHSYTDTPTPRPLIHCIEDLREWIDSHRLSSQVYLFRMVKKEIDRLRIDMPAMYHHVRDYINSDEALARRNDEFVIVDMTGKSGLIGASVINRYRLEDVKRLACLYMYYEAVRERLMLLAAECCPAMLDGYNVTDMQATHFFQRYEAWKRHCQWLDIADPRDLSVLDSMFTKGYFQSPPELVK